MSLHRNRVQMGLSAPAGNPGTGTITLGSATAGYQSFASAYGADATVDILITEGNNWEVCRNCTYTNSGTTVTRGTLEDSSAGAITRVSFTTAAIVSVIGTAASGNNWGLNEVQASPTGAGVTGVVGTMHILDISGLTASRDFTLPATCAVGDRVGVFIRTGDDAFELSLKPATGDTINGGSSGAEWSRLFIRGECVIFRCITADTDWIVEYDGRIPQYGRLELTTDCDGETSNVFTLPTSAATPGAWTAQENRGIGVTVGSGRLTVRRDGVYAITAVGRTKDTSAGSQMSISIYKSGVEIVRNTASLVASQNTGGSISTINTAVTADFYQLYYVTAAGGLGLRSANVLTQLSVGELL